jgi:threonine/homoserine/homoserine lactone efflux protein
MTGHFTLFLAASALLAITPGPGIFYVAARTLNGGRREGLLSIAGTAVGGLVHVLAGAVGVSALVMASAEAFTVLKFAGAAYLVWLGIKTLLSVQDDGSLAAAPGGRAFRDGVAVEALNPKTAMFFLAFIPQFIDPAHGVALQFAVLGTISVALNSLADVAVALAATRLRARALTPGLLRWTRRASGTVMCGLGVSLALVRRA